MSKAWEAPHWWAPEDSERYETMVEALHDVVKAVRDCSHRVNSAKASDLSAWEARVTAITREAEEWAGRVNRLLTVPSETSIVGPEGTP